MKKVILGTIITAMFLLCSCGITTKTNETTGRNTAATVSTKPVMKKYKNFYKSFYYKECSEKGEYDIEDEGIEIGGVDTLKLADLYDFFDQEYDISIGANILTDFVRITSDIKHIEALPSDKFNGGSKIELSMGTLIIETDSLLPRDIFELVNGLFADQITYHDKEYYYDEGAFYRDYFPHMKKKQGFLYGDDVVFGVDKEKAVLRIPEGFTAIAPYAFASIGDDFLRELYLPDSLKIVGNGAFMLQEKINCIDLGDGVEEIGANAFSGKVKSLTIPQSVRRIGYYALDLKGKSLKEVTFEGNTKGFPTDDIEEIFDEDCKIGETTLTFTRGIKEAFALVGDYALKKPKKEKHAYLTTKWTRVTGADGYRVELADLNDEHLSSAVYQGNEGAFTLPRDIDYIRVYIEPYQIVNGEKVYGRKTQYCIDESIE